MSDGSRTPSKGKGPPETPPGQDKSGPPQGHGPPATPPGQDKPKPPHGPPHVPPGQAKEKPAKGGNGGVPPLPFASDLTRWNRAGLSRFEYVDGNAATYLELLRQALALRFPDRWDALRTGLPEDLDQEPAGDRLERMLEQYLRERGDWGWEIARALARVCHVLTGHLDVYANEGYLGTATQWDNVRRLVEMLDYSPAPPASATARLVLRTKGEEGTVEQGFQVQHTPPDGGAPVIFETLEDLDVDPALDVLRPAGWNRSPRTFQERRESGLSSGFVSRPALDLQGVGPVYARWLDEIRRSETGDPEARFRIVDFRRLSREGPPPFAFDLPGRPDQPREILRLRLRELQGKADVLFDVSWTAAEVRPLLDWTLADLVAADAVDLALRSSRYSGEMKQLQDELRQVEIVLDQPVFNTTRLRELVPPETEASPGHGAVPAARSPWIAPEKSKISAVDLGLVIRDPGTAEAVVVTVDWVDPLNRAVILGDVPSQQPWRHWTRGETSLQVKAGFLRRPRLNGPDVVAFEDPHDLNPGEVVAWEDDDTWSFSRVEESDERAVRLADGSFPESGTEIYRTFAIERVENGLLFPVDYEVAARESDGDFLLLTDGDSEVVPGTDADGNTLEGAEYRKLKDTGGLGSVMEIYLVPDGAAPVGRVTAVPAGEFVFDGKPGKLGSAQWVVADDGDLLWPLKVQSIVQREDHFVVVFEPSATPPRPAGHRAVGDLPCSVLQGVGPKYSAVLEEAGIFTVAKLSELKAADLVGLDGISPVRRWEITTKADFLLGLEADPDKLAPIAHAKLGDLLATPTEELVGKLWISTTAIEELKDHLRMCEACLIESAFRELTVRDLLPEERATDSVTGEEDHLLLAFQPSAGRRPVGNRPCSALQGVGPKYSAVLREAGIDTVAGLSELTAADLGGVRGISPVRRWEMKIKADFLLGLGGDPEKLAPIVDRKLTSVLALPTEELAGLLSSSIAAAEELEDYLLMCKACLVESAFRELTVRDLLPQEPAFEGVTRREVRSALAFQPFTIRSRDIGDRPVGNRPCIAIEGVGSVYSDVLTRAGVGTLAELRDLDTRDLSSLEGIPLVHRWEFKAKADYLLGLRADPEALAPIADRTLAAAVATSTEELAGLLSTSTAAAKELKNHLRMCEACLDENVFLELTVRELLPERRPATTGGSTTPSLPTRLVRLYGLFEHALRPTGWDRNDTPLTGDRIVLDLTELEDEKIPGLLVRGRRVVLEREVLPETEDDDVIYAGAVATQVEEVDADAGAVVLDLAVPLATTDGFTLGNAVLRGNVVSAGHGEKKPEKVLGSGDAARSNQRFVLAEEGVSFVADATQPSGVRADITVRVEDRAWQQVANLRDSGPADAQYAVRMTEDGYLAVDFGDGRHGRRLPTGGNNVRISFRVGTGLAGNLDAGSLAKAARPHRRVKSVRQPLKATGGNDMEDIRSLKENAPASVLTLERAVSVGDLGHLAARQSSVWQARAVSLPTALSRRESVEVVVVPAGGGELGTLEESLRKTLQAHTLPGVDVRISPADMTPFDVAVTVRVKSAEYDPDQVVESVRLALLDAFSLERRRLGQDLFLSEVYQVVEGTQGVESSICTIDGDQALRRLDASDDEVFYLSSDPGTSEIGLRHEEWTL